jgi:hypothetical protein
LMLMLFLLNGTRPEMQKKRQLTKEKEKENPTSMRCLMFKRQH